MGLWRQEQVRQFYGQRKVQLVVAFVIFLNFFASAIEMQLLPNPDSSAGRTFYALELAFTAIFVADLACNLYGLFFRRFWLDAWNVFDFVIVSSSLLSLVLSDVPGISVLRLLRAFRAFRLFNRIKSMKHIIEGVMASLPGVFSAFLILFVLMGIWAIMSVEFYGDVSDEDFGTFAKAMFTMWQVLTGDSWVSGIGRRYTFTEGMPLSALFFISYVFVAAILMSNVVVAILLDRYLNATSTEGVANPNSTTLLGVVLGTLQAPQQHGAAVVGKGEGPSRNGEGGRPPEPQRPKDEDRSEEGEWDSALRSHTNHDHDDDHDDDDHDHDDHDHDHPKPLRRGTLVETGVVVGKEEEDNHKVALELAEVVRAMGNDDDGDDEEGESSEGPPDLVESSPPTAPPAPRRAMGRADILVAQKKELQDVISRVIGSELRQASGADLQRVCAGLYRDEAFREAIEDFCNNTDLRG